MPKAVTTHNSNEPDPSIDNRNGSRRSAAAESHDFENNGSSAPFINEAVVGGRTVRVRLAPTSFLAPDGVLESTSRFGGGDALDDAAVDGEPDPYNAPESSALSMQLRRKKWRGSRPKGDWKTRAREIDFSSSSAVEAAIPPYSGESRYGQEPFPLVLLVNEDGSWTSDGVECYRRVTEWRKLSPRDQQLELQWQAAFTNFEEKETKAAEAAEKRAARKKATDEKRNKNKREARKAAKERAANAGDADGDDVGDTTGDVPVINSRVLNPTRFAGDSACAQVAQKKHKHRKQSDKAIRESQLDDRAARRSQQTLLKQFKDSAVSITPAPGTSSHSWRMVNNLLIELDEDSAKTRTKIGVHVSHGDFQCAEKAIYRLLRSGLFDQALQRVIDERNLTPRPLRASTFNGDSAGYKHTATFVSNEARDESNNTPAAPVETSDESTPESIPPMPPLPPVDGVLAMETTFNNVDELMQSLGE